MSTSSPQPWEFQTEIVLTEECSRRLRAEFVAASPEWRVHFAREHRELTRILWGGAIAFACGFTLIFGFPRSFLTLSGLGAMQVMLIAIGLASAVVGVRRFAALRSVAAVSAAGTGVASRSPATCQFHLSDKGIRVIAPNLDRTRPWANYCDVQCLPSFVIIDAVEFDSVAIPRAAFASEHDCQHFVSKVRSVVEGGGSSSSVLIPEYLRDHMVACPGCKYNLQGASASTCPECGRALTLADVPHARLLRHAATLATDAPSTPRSGQSTNAS